MKRSKMNPFAAMALLTAVVSFSASNALAVTYDAYIASTNPVGWWGMNETGVTTTTADLSGAYGAANNQAAVNLDLTYQGLGTNTISNQAGYVVSSGTNSAAYFDGTTNSGLYGHGAAPYDLAVTGAIYRYEPNGFAGEYWIKRDGDIAGLDSQRVVATREYGFGFRQSDSMLHFTTFGKVDYFSTVSLPSDGNWHQIGFSFDGNVTMSFYIDGVTAGTAVGANGGIRTALSPAANTIIHNISRAPWTKRCSGARNARLKTSPPATLPPPRPSLNPPPPCLGCSACSACCAVAGTEPF